MFSLFGLSGLLWVNIRIDCTSANMHEKMDNKRALTPSLTDEPPPPAVTATAAEPYHPSPPYPVPKPPRGSAVPEPAYVDPALATATEMTEFHADGSTEYLVETVAPFPPVQ